MRKRFLLSSAALFAFAAMTLASAPEPSFRAVPGVQEFSGRMIARPLQMEALMRQTPSPSLAWARQAQARAAVSRMALEYVPETDEYTIVLPRGENENSLSRSLMATGNFEYVEPDWIVYPAFTTPNDPRYNNQWHLPKIGAPLAWTNFRGQSDMIVAICDTGVRLDHEDLVNQLVPGYNSVDQLAQANGGQVTDINGHGTHVAGTAAAQSNNGRGVAGVGWNFRIMPIRVSNETNGNASITTLTRGARWASDNGARVINTSYSGVSSSSVQTTGAYIKARNGLYVWAAGNSNVSMNTFDHPDVIIVGATDQNDNKASFSNFGVALDVYAPGVSIQATLRNSATSYGNMSGTSMAAPVAAGVTAMIMATNPNLTPNQVQTILYETCHDLGEPGNDPYWGWGRVNLNAAIRRAYEDHPFTPTGVTIVDGVLVSGDVASVQSSNGALLTVATDHMKFRGNSVIELDFVGKSTLLSVGGGNLRFDGRSNVSEIQQELYLFDWLTNAFVLVDSRPAAMTVMPAEVTVVNPHRYVQAGTGDIRTRVRFRPNGPNVRRFYTIEVDHLGWFTTPQ
jgi:hypothetical protein